MQKELIAGLLGVIAVFASAGAAPLVSNETIQAQKQLTSMHKLSNGIPVIYREIPNSDILEVVVNFGIGLKDLPAGQKSAGRLLFQTMPMAAKGYAKREVFRTTEKYALELNCGSGIETSKCSIGTLNEHWPETSKLFAAIIKEPALTSEDVKLNADRLIAEVKGNIQDPGRFVNDVVNRVYYERGHPFANDPEEIMREVPKLGRKDLIALHGRTLDASKISITVAGSFPKAQMLADLEKKFGKIKDQREKMVAVVPPPFKLENAIAFENRDIPTAYIRAKFDTVAVNNEDETAVNMLIKILDEELSEEIRTRRSLSYAVYSFVIQYSVGIGVISASTSKPQETLEAITVVLNKLKHEKLKPEDLEEYRNLYATDYYLTLEKHSSLANAISATYFYRNAVDPLYEIPRRLEQVTPEKIQDLANKLLVNMRIGIIYSKDRFKDDWAKKFVAETLPKQQKG